MATIEQDMIREQASIAPLLTISETAAQRLLAMMREKELEGYSLRVFVAGGGCSGLQYGMTFDNEIREDEHTLAAYGLSMIIDPVSARYITGASIDYVDNIMGGGFKIDNPNAVASCGCGHSFRTDEGADDADASGGYGCSSSSCSR